MKSDKKCPECSGELVQIPEGVGTMYICDVLYCDHCDKEFDLEFDKEEVV